MSIPRRVFNNRRVGGDEHQVVGCGRARYIGEIIVAECKLSSVREVRGDVLRNELFADCGRLACQPRVVAVVRILRWRILRPRHSNSICSGKRAKVIVEAVVFLDDEYHVVDWPPDARGRLHPTAFSFCRFSFLDHVSETLSVCT